MVFFWELLIFWVFFANFMQKKPFLKLDTEMWQISLYHWCISGFHAWATLIYYTHVPSVFHWAFQVSRQQYSDDAQPFVGIPLWLEQFKSFPSNPLSAECWFQTICQSRFCVEWHWTIYRNSVFPTASMT